MMPDRDGTRGAGVDGFNPCCIGLDNDAMARRQPPLIPQDVSILVVLDWTMMPGIGPIKSGHYQVSILVVLDWTMMRCYQFRRVAPVSAFQSLLYWIGQ